MARTRWVHCTGTTHAAVAVTCGAPTCNCCVMACSGPRVLLPASAPTCDWTLQASLLQASIQPAASILVAASSEVAVLTRPLMAAMCTYMFRSSPLLPSLPPSERSVLESLEEDHMLVQQVGVLLPAPRLCPAELTSLACSPNLRNH